MCRVCSPLLGLIREAKGDPPINEAERAELQSRLEAHQELDRSLGRAILGWERELTAPGELPPEQRALTEEALKHAQALSVALQGHIARFVAWLAEEADIESRDTKL